MTYIIVKVQRPIATSHPNPEGQWLFYNEDKSYQETREPTKKEKKAINNDLKMYAKYDVKTMKFLRRIKDQWW